MWRLVFAILASVSLLLSLAAVALWAASYRWAGSVMLRSSGATPVPLPPMSSSTSSAMFVENRSGHVIVLMQWVTLQRLSDDPQHTYVDAGEEARTVNVGAFRQFEEFAGGGRTYSMVGGLGVPDILRVTPDRAIRILLWRWGIAYQAEDPGPLRLVLRKDGAFPDLDAVRTGDVAADGSVRARLSGYSEQLAGHRQLMLPYWLLVLLGLVLPLLWLRTNRQSVRWARQGRCTGCGYDLRASPDRCPECGEPC